MKLAIFDKDGTLVKPISDNKFVQHPEDQKLLPGVAERLAEMFNDGWIFAIASNQGGVAAGHKSLEDAKAEMLYCLELLPPIARVYFCPDFEGLLCWAYSRDLGWHESGSDFSEWNFRKPNDGMLALAQYQLVGFNKAQIVFIGDRAEDKQAAASAGVDFVWAHEWLKPDSR